MADFTFPQDRKGLQRPQAKSDAGFGKDDSCLCKGPEDIVDRVLGALQAGFVL